MICRLCLSYGELHRINGADNREYYLCDNCKMVNVHHNYFPEKEEEKKRYLTHKNGIEYEGYVNFLNQAINPALKYIKKEMTGLDYGCGYAPTISKLLKRKGIICEDYDPFFVNNRIDKSYDFIFSTEVFEHFFHPAKEIEKLYSILKTGGLLIIMTERWRSIKEFKDWYYTKDPTHISFYHTKTFDFICSNYSFEKLYDDNNRVIILRKA